MLQKAVSFVFTYMSCLFLGLFCSIFLNPQVDSKNDWIFENSKSLLELWELDKEHERGTFLISSYKPIYFSIGKFSTNTNNNPISENSDERLPEPVNLNALARTDELVEELISGGSTLHELRLSIQNITHAKALYPHWMNLVAFIVAGGAFVLLLSTGWHDLLYVAFFL